MHVIVHRLRDNGLWNNTKLGYQLQVLFKVLLEVQKGRKIRYESVKMRLFVPGYGYSFLKAYRISPVYMRW